MAASVSAPNRWGSTRAMCGLVGLCGAVLLMPSANYQAFDGLPLSRAPEYLLGVVLLPLVCHRGLRAVLGRFLGLHRHLAAGVWTIAAVALVLKVGLFASGDYSGLQACYGSPLSAPPAGRCEASFENPWSRFGVTRFDERIDFALDHWNLSFLNSLRFNIYPWVKGNRLRDRLPVTATWTGWLQASGARVAAIDYVGDGQVAIGARSVPLAPTYGRVSSTKLPIPAGTHRVLVQYRFDDGSRVGDPVRGPSAWLRIRYQDEAGAEADVALAPPGRSHDVLRAAGRAADVLIAAVGVVLVAFFVQLLAREWWWFALIGAAFVLTPAVVESTAPRLDSLKSVAACVVVLLGVLFRRHARDAIGAFFALVILGLALLWPLYGSLQMVVLRTAGDDWLTYESYARAILEMRSLEGGEPVFHYQPLFRYIRFGERLLLGDGDLLIAASAFAALLLSIIWMLRRFCRRRSPLSLGMCCAAGLLMVTAASSSAGALRFLLLGASEYPTWILLPALLSRLFAARSRRAYLSGTSMLALSALARLNQLPALLVIFAAFVCRVLRRPGLFLAASGVLVAVLLLGPAHNLYYGGKAELLTTSSGTPENYVLPPARIVAALHDGEARSALVSQLRHVLARHPMRSRSTTPATSSQGTS